MQIAVPRFTGQGMEIELNKSWRVEPYYAFDKDKVPTVESVNRLGLVLKYYR